jgi:hypothetical protein
MPKIAIYKYLVFFIYAYDLNERRHLHIEARKGKRRYSAKVFIENGIEVIEKGNLSDSEINLSVKLIEKNFKLINKQIDHYLAGKKLKPIELKLK